MAFRVRLSAFSRGIRCNVVHGRRLVSTTSFDASDASSAEQARLTLSSAGYEPISFWEQPVVWGDHDSFQHVNNVHYVRYFESGRIKWLSALAYELGGPDKVRAMLTGKGVSLILKTIQVKYKRPVTYPDTLLIGQRPYPISGSTTHFGLLSAAYSYAQQAVVAECDCTLVWYDYEKLKKCIPGERENKILWKGATAVEHVT